MEAVSLCSYAKFQHGKTARNLYPKSAPPMWILDVDFINVASDFAAFFMLLNFFLGGCNKLTVWLSFPQLEKICVLHFHI